MIDTDKEVGQYASWPTGKRIATLKRILPWVKVEEVLAALDLSCLPLTVYAPPTRGRTAIHVVPFKAANPLAAGGFNLSRGSEQGKLKLPSGGHQEMTVAFAIPCHTI